MKYFTLLITLFSFNILLGQVEDIAVNDPAGKFDREFLQTGEFGKHFMNEYKNYTLDLDLINPLEKDIYKYDITIVLATWCHDSQIQVPRFIKILDKLNYNTKNVEIICVDKEKKAGNINIEMFNIEFVPTFIFYKNDKEKGRIIESPNTYLEKDMVNIIKEL